MSMVALPFHSEDPNVAGANLEMAASHPRVSHVAAVGAEGNHLFGHLTRVAARLSTTTGKRVEVILQDRIGDRRPGKGDGMNTGVLRFLDSGLDRLHFYDSDITNFDHSWIDGAERAADAGFDIVRHYFPRASTDAMVTWMITRPLFAIGHPDSRLWELRQPLAGELLVTRPIAETLVDDVVSRRSDWGIDTMIAYATARTGRPIYEHYVAGGKQHRLYGSLEELTEMVHECFEAAADVTRMPPPPQFEHRVDPPKPAPRAVTERVAYDIEATLHLLNGEWSPEETEAARAMPGHVAEPLLSNLADHPRFAFLDADRWYDTLVSLVDLYRPEQGWRTLLFRLWVARVLAYTTTDALAGHARAMARLEEIVAGYARRGRP